MTVSMNTVSSCMSMDKCGAMSAKPGFKKSCRRDTPSSRKGCLVSVRSFGSQSRMITFDTMKDWAMHVMRFPRHLYGLSSQWYVWRSCLFLKWDSTCTSLVRSWRQHLFTSMKIAMVCVKRRSMNLFEFFTAFCCRSSENIFTASGRYRQACSLILK